MAKFDPNSSNCVVVRYPTGGYGNFLYYLLSEHLESTVKSKSADWEFSDNGNSHNYPKHVEKFQLGSHVRNRTTKNFDYTYNIIDPTVEQQIQQGKKFLVLADVGNTGDNIKFLKRYFPNSTIVRVFAENFIEKLILWANCMTKSTADLRNDLYPGSIMPANGIAIWANKSVDDVNDNDAIGCMVNFFQRDFDVYGKFFNRPVDDAINIPISSFFSQDSIYKVLNTIAHDLDTQVVDTLNLEPTVLEFLNHQSQLSLLDPDATSFPLVRRALAQYENTHHV